MYTYGTAHEALRRHVGVDGCEAAAREGPATASEAATTARTCGEQLQLSGDFDNKRACTHHHHQEA